MAHDDWIDGLRAAANAGTPWKRHPRELDCPLDAAYALQARHLEELLAATGDAVIGAKLSVTSAPAMERLGLRAPLLGPLLRGRSHASGASLPRASFFACILEAEIGIALRADLDGRSGAPSRAEIVAAIDSVFPAIEVADSRYLDWAQAPACAIVADLSYAGAWVRGAPCAEWRDLDLRTLPVTLTRSDGESRAGSGAAVLGDPLHALALAVAEAASRGRVFRAGEMISTGACTAPWPVAGPGSFVADFGALGRVELTLG
jgi:2-keto-4-pentenoate hydratase